MSGHSLGATACARRFDPDSVFLLGRTFDDRFGNDLDLRFRRGFPDRFRFRFFFYLDLRFRWESFFCFNPRRRNWFGNWFGFHLYPRLRRRFLFLLDLRLRSGFFLYLGLRRSRHYRRCGRNAVNGRFFSGSGTA